MTKVAEHPAGFAILNGWSRPRGVFDTFEAARQACRKARTIAQPDAADLVEPNFELSVRRRASDYPVLFWLCQIASTGSLRVLDFGGGAGQSYYQYRDLLPAGAIERWTVLELPTVVEQGKRKAAERGANNLVFTSSFREGAACNVLLAAGSLHYWEGSLSSFAAEVGGLPKHVIVNRSPMRATGDAFITVQTGAHWAVPCLVRSLDQLTQEMEALGFDRVDDWNEPEKTLHFPWLPDHEARYLGVYFRR